MSNSPGPLGQRIAAELRAELGRQNRSRRWLAEQIGSPHNTVARWVGGDTPPSLDALDAMCRALGLSVADLLVAVEKNGGYEPADSMPRRVRRTSSSDGLESDIRGYGACDTPLAADVDAVYAEAGQREPVAA